MLVFFFLNNHVVNNIMDDVIDLNASRNSLLLLHDLNPVDSLSFCSDLDSVLSTNDNLEFNNSNISTIVDFYCISIFKSGNVALEYCYSKQTYL